MKINRVVKLFFSPTNATRQVVEAVAGALDAPKMLELNRTPFENRWSGAELGEGDLAVIGVPVYYGRVPQIMTEFFRDITAKNIPAILVVTYGNRAYEDALLELKDLSMARGFLPVAAAAFIGQHSFTDKMGTGRPNGEDLAQAAAFGAGAKALLEGCKDLQGLTLHVPGNFPYQVGSDLPIAPTTDKAKCNGCMLCQKGCPVQAINPLDPAEIDPWRCLDCAKCIRNCPKGAKSLAVPALQEKIIIMEARFADPKQPETFLAQ
ncbi:MAG: 4Fe-4S dicluster domain-containing protein [Pseudoflavonifractor sp.]